MNWIPIQKAKVDYGQEVFARCYNPESDSPFYSTAILRDWGWEVLKDSYNGYLSNSWITHIIVPQPPKE